MIDNTKFKYHLGDTIAHSYAPVSGIIIGYYFLGGFNNYTVPYGYCVEILDENIRTHSGETYGYQSNGERISPIYSNKILYIAEGSCTLVKAIRNLIYKIKL